MDKMFNKKFLVGSIFAAFVLISCFLINSDFSGYKKIDKVEALSANDNLINLATDQIQQDKNNGSFIQLQNGSFEIGHENVPIRGNAMAEYKIVDTGEQDGNGAFSWTGFRTDTGEPYSMEVQRYLLPTYDGDWYAELSPDRPIGLSQDIATVPGVTVYWSIYYAKRASEVERAGIYFGPVPTTGINSDNLLDEAYRQNVVGEDGNTYTLLGEDFGFDPVRDLSRWHRYEGTYVIPAGQEETRFQFRSVASATVAEGNSLDLIEFASGSKLRVFNKYENDVFVVGDDMTHKFVMSNSGGMSANNVQIEVQLPESVSYSNKGVDVINSYDEVGNVIANTCTVSNVLYDPATHRLSFTVNEVKSLELIEFSMDLEAESADNFQVDSDDNAIVEVNVSDYENGSYGNQGVGAVDPSQDGTRIVRPLTIEKTVDKETGVHGEELTYHLVLKNENNVTGNADNISVKDIIPDGSEYVPGTLTVNGAAKTDLNDGDGASFVKQINNFVEFEIDELLATKNMTLSFKVKATCISDVITNFANVEYQWKEDIKKTVKNLDSNETETNIQSVILHTRQVILSESDQLVVPTEGYLRIKTNDFDQLTGTTTENIDQLCQVTIPSGKNADNPPFETFVVNTKYMENELDELNLALILPEYYEQIGYYLTLAQFDSNGAEHQGKTEADITPSELILNQAALDDDEEYFITIYLKPKINQDGPQPYSWDYKKNDLGKIKTK